MGNPPRDGHSLIAPGNLDWFALFSFDEVGYVRDDGKLDAAALLDALRRGDAQANEERKRLGIAPMHTDGWQVPPYYDAGARRLAWGLRMRDERGGLRANYSSRLLGRRGVMSAVLVSPTQMQAAAIHEFNGVLAGFQFLPGEQYGEFREGDKVADVALAALVAEGASQASGTFAWWTVLAAVVSGLVLSRIAFARHNAKVRGPDGPAKS